MRRLDGKCIEGMDIYAYLLKTKGHLPHVLPLSISISRKVVLKVVCKLWYVP